VTFKQSQRDCVSKPKVAVLGYLGTSRAMERNPNGVVSYSPRLLYSATLGPRARWSAIPTGLCRTAQGCCTQVPWESVVSDPNPNGVASLMIDLETRPAATLSG
jgi:hypothetical protein